MKSICFIFPHPVEGPTGGYKVVYGYANRLVNEGVEVHIVYSGSVFWRRKSWFHKLTNLYRNLEWRVKGYSGRRWFPLDSRVKEYLTLSMNQRHVPEADVYVATSPYTAWYLSRYPIEKSRKFYFIQDYENWGPGLRDILEETFHAPLNKIVVSKWLQKKLHDEYGEVSTIIPNGFDFNVFKFSTPIKERNPYTISMMWHEMPRKDCCTGLKAIEIIKQRYPQLHVLMFGVPSRPQSLPEWIEYYCQPTDKRHLWINNTASIYLATSKVEGWGLTVGEAMACGQAVVCTDIDGYREMAVDKRNALLVPVGDFEAMAEKICELIDDSELRMKIAKQALDDIRSFTWEDSYKKLKQTIL